MGERLWRHLQGRGTPRSVVTLLWRIGRIGRIGRIYGNPVVLYDSLISISPSPFTTGLQVLDSDEKISKL